jgi:hypothetical protein
MLHFKLLEKQEQPKPMFIAMLFIIAKLWWECKLVQLLWRAVLMFLEVNDSLTIWSNCPTPGIKPKERKSDYQRETCMPVFYNSTIHNN